MGATPLQIVRKVLLPEARPGIVLGLTLTLVSLLAQLAADRAEMLAYSETKESTKPEGNGSHPIPFWLWHMF
jgi:ABC-type phosphate transport system permease subunit